MSRFSPQGWQVRNEASCTSTRQIFIYALLLLLPYLLLLELPYRRGIARWRAARLSKLEQGHNLAAQRLDRSRGRNLDATDPHVVEAYYRWQYYGKQIEEVKAVPASPYSLGQRAFTVILGIAGAFLIDQASDLLRLIVPHITR